MALERILKQRHYRRSFIATIIAILCFLLLLRHLGIPQLETALLETALGSWKITHIAADIIDKLITSFIVTITIGSFLYWLTPSVMEIANLSAVEPGQINKLLSSAMSTTERWYYKGSCGRYLRSVTVPEMGKASRIDSSSRVIVAIILNPADENVCRSYAEYRNSVNSASMDALWTAERVENELLATVISLWYEKKKNSLLHITLGLIGTFSTFRIDLSSSYVILTKEDPRAPGIRCDRDTYFYRAYLEEINLTLRQIVPVSFPHELPDLDKLTPENVHSLLLRKEVAPRDINVERCTSILELVRTPKNPYA